MERIGSQAAGDSLDMKLSDLLMRLGFDFRVQISFHKGGQSIASLVNIHVEPDLHVYRQVLAFHGR